MISRAYLLVRVMAVVMAAIVGLTALLKEWKPGPEVLPPALANQDPRTATFVAAGGAVLIALFTLAFIALFWRTTAPRSGASSRRVLWLIAVQFLAAVLVDSDLMYLLAAEVGFVLPNRAGVKWMIAQSTLFGLVVVLAGTSGGNVEYLGIAPRWLELLLAYIYFLGWCLFAYSVGYLASSEHRSRMELLQGNAELLAAQHLLGESSRQSERLRISRELHDSLGHHLMALSVNLQLAARQAGEEAAVALDRAQLVVRLLLAEVRETVGSLRQDAFIDLRGALLHLIDVPTTPAVHLEMAGDATLGDPAVAHALYRAAQEMITNARKHSGAQNLWLAVRRRDGGIELTARDDGRGSAGTGEGNGLTGMRERLERLGGRLDVATSPGQGFRLTAWSPVGGEAA